MFGKNRGEKDAGKHNKEQDNSAKEDVNKNEQKKNTEEEKDADKVKGSVSDYFRIYKYATSFDWMLLGICALTSIGAGAALPLMFVVFGRLVNNISSYSNPAEASDPANFTRSINQNSLYIVYVFIGKFVLSYASLYAVRISGLRISAAIRLKYVEALFRQPLSYIDTLSVGKVSTRITSSANTIQLGISQQLAMLIQAVSFLIGFYVVAFTYNAILTLVASASLPLVFIIYSIPLPLIIANVKKVEGAKEKAAALAHEVFASIRVIAAFGAEKRVARRHEIHTLEARRLDLKNGPLMGMLISPTMFMLYGTCALTFWFGIRQFTRHNVDDVGTVAIVYFAVSTAMVAIGRIGGPLISMSSAASAAAQMFATLDEVPQDLSGLKAPHVSAEEDIHFDNVSFAYPSRPDVVVLDHMSVTFEAGKTTAIVGPSGSGKSTIVGLLQRWYELDQCVPVQSNKTPADNEPGTPTDPETEVRSGLEADVQIGTIRIGDKSLKEVDAYWWRNQIGFVQQEPFLFNDTIYKNVAYGLYGTKEWDESDQVKRQLVKEACREAFADDFISVLPLGYDTLVGENGLKLSGGQRQRVAIARSIIKKPKILVLDEATSALDVRSEKVVQEALDRVSKGRTTIIIAHRLSTIKRADKIVVLRKGVHVEEGTHEGLLRNPDSVYSSLVGAQAIEFGGDDGSGQLSNVPDAVEELKKVTSMTVEAAKSSEDQDTTKTKESPRKVKKRYLRSFLKLVGERVPKLWIIYTAILVSALVAGATYPLMAYIFGQLINVFSLTGSELSDRGNFWSLMLFIMSLAVLVAYFIIGWAAMSAAVIVATHYRQEYFENLVQKPIPFFDAEGSSPGTLTSRLTTDTTQMQQLMGVEMALIVISIFNMVGSAIISLVFSWKLGLIGLFVIMPIVVCAGLVRIRLEIKFQLMNEDVFAESSQFATEAIGAFRTVTSLTMESLIINRYAVLLKNQATTALKKAITATIVFAASDSLDILCTAFVFWYGGRLLASRELDVLDFFVIYMAVVQSSQAAGQFFAHSPNIAEAGAGANRILEYRMPPLKDTSGYGPSFKPGPVSLEFKNAHFTYESREDPVLAGLNLKIEAGQFAALVGASGCGKSTVISLIERFYNLDSGVILCDGIDIATTDIHAYRSRLSIVSQEPTLFEGSIRQNVALSVEASEATDDKIQAACREAQIHDFITSLPDGYDTELGPKGISLSGGQRQRLCLARALLRHPGLLLLDEATSSLDSESEKQVQVAIEQTAGKGGITILAVAHRLATIQNADVIFVMEKGGKVVEKGSHRELIAKRGVYYEMCQSQALDR